MPPDDLTRAAPPTLGEALDAGDDVAGYAYARTGYHRALDSLRRNGWRGQGPVPWEHAPNRGFLRCLAVLSKAAGVIGETDEEQRCASFLADSSATAYAELTGTSQSPSGDTRSEVL